MLAKTGLANVRTWVELDRRAARHNCRVFRKLILPGVKLFAVVKSNAYGHGIFVMAKMFSECGVDGFCVDSITEGLALRRRGIKKQMLVLGPTLFNLYNRAAAEKIIITVPDLHSLRTILQKKNPPDFHLKIDTGMHRQGLYPEETRRAVELLAKSRRRGKLKGVYTHFAYASDNKNGGYAERQFREFRKIKDDFLRAGFKNLLFHAAATGGALLNKKYHLDAVRIGLGLYGIYPSKKMAKQYRRLNLRPVLSWRTLVADVKELRPGDRVGYDLTETVGRRSKMAVLPVGYWHGLPWSVSGKGEVLIRGRRAKILGRVSMDLTVVDVGRVSCRPGEEVTLIGRDGREEISAWEAADRAGSMVYEVITRLNPLIEKVIVPELYPRT
jgi:alanine racemase